MHAIAYDEIHDEIYVTQQFGQGILVFRGAATGEEPPVRVINGSKTQLIAPDRLAVDPVHDEIYVPEGVKLLVYPRTANGNVAPIRVITGPGHRHRRDARGDGRSAAQPDHRGHAGVGRRRRERGPRGSELRIFARTGERQREAVARHHRPARHGQPRRRLRRRA